MRLATYMYDKITIAAHSPFLRDMCLGEETMNIFERVWTSDVVFFFFGVFTLDFSPQHTVLHGLLLQDSRSKNVPLH